MAYRTWGDRFIERIAGDYCFVIWDQSRRRLLCYRDQLGVLPLYYILRKSLLAVSDRLDWLAEADRGDGDLDRQWIADFLIHGYSMDPARTVYAGIRRLRPAHVLTIDETSSNESRYWTLQVAEPLYLQREEDYTGRFVDLLGAAIGDRLPENGVTGVCMSGGLDSTTLAAVTLRKAGHADRVVAHTQYLAGLLPDDEVFYSKQAAEALGIAHIRHAIDDETYDPDWGSNPLQLAEPSFRLLNLRHTAAMHADMQRHAKVWFWGEGPDNALEFDWRPYLRWLAGRREWRRLSVAVTQYIQGKRLRDWLATFDPRLWTARTKPPPDGCPPPWIAPDLLRQCGGPPHGQAPHPWRPAAMAGFTHPILAGFLAGFEPVPGAPDMHWRHPYLDLRVLTFMLSLPPIPWARRKYILRRAMQGVLPDAILSRDKKGVPSALFASLSAHRLPNLEVAPGLAEFVDASKAPVQPGRENLYQALAVHILNHWLAARG